MKFLALVVGFLLSFSTVSFSQTRDKHFLSLREGKLSEVPSFVKITKGHEFPVNNLKPWLQGTFNVSTNFEFIPINSFTDEKGNTHKRYKQAFQNIPIEHAVLVVHSKNGMVYSLNGDIFQMRRSVIK